jgi:alkane 1-monooxygenase
MSAGELKSARSFAPEITRHAYWLVVILPLLMPAAWALRGLPGGTVWFAWLPAVLLYGLLPLADVWLGRDGHNPKIKGGGMYPDRLIPILGAGVYLLVLAWSLMLVGREGATWPLLSRIGWTLSLGSIGGILAINIAHELIHRREPWLQRLGGVLLSCVCYAGFKLEHPKWHHVKVATPDDPSSAAVGTTIYGQMPRALVMNTIRAWRLAVQGARARGRPLPWLQHELTGWWVLSASFFTACWLALGSTAAWVFVGQSLVAAGLLEVINYVEHYGLKRKKLDEQRFEPPSVAHSWNADFWLSNAILLQLQRHSDHHVHPSRPFSELQSVRDAPQLPLGYAALTVIAFFPPLWRRLIHPRLPQ